MTNKDNKIVIDCDNIILTAIQITTGLNYGSKQSYRYLEQVKRTCHNKQNND